MKYVYSICMIVVGAYFFYMTYKDGRKKKATFTYDYMLHFRGYIGGIGLIIGGILMLIDAIEE